MFEKRCKLCDQIVYQNYKLTNSDHLWYHCACGCMFHGNYVSPEEVFTKDHNEKLSQIKNHEDRAKYFARVYGPLIEERIYGRKLLDVGFGTDILMNEWQRRGWVVNGIDICPNDYITGNFESYDFWKQGHDRYDMIWMGDVLQCFVDPVKAIYKAYNLLNPNGILFIITPNTDLMRKNRISGWGHWDQRENKQFISYGILKDILNRCDESLTGKIKIIYSDENLTSKRFITYSNMHVIAQKQKIEDFSPISDIEVKQESIVSDIEVKKESIPIFLNSSCH